MTGGTDAGAGWRDIATAPRDGTRILAAVDGAVRVVAYGKTSHLPWRGFCLADQGAEDFDLCKPTHWQPLPAPPAAPPAPDGWIDGSNVR